MFGNKKKWNGYFDPCDYPKGNWIVPSEPKVSYIERKQTHGLNRVIMNMMKVGAKAPDTINVFKVLAHLKGILVPYTNFFFSIYKMGGIKNAEKEEIIMRAAWRLGCIYEYSQHRPFLAGKGYSEELLDSFASEEDSPLWSDRQTAVFHCVDDLVANHLVSDEHMKALKKYYDDDQVVQFCMLVGHYIMIACTAESTGVTVENYTWLNAKKNK